MKTEIIKCLQDNYSYLIIDSKKNACVVDPGEAEPVIKFVEKNNLKLKYILNTHHHFDHIGGNSEIKKKYGSKILGYKDDKDVNMHVSSEVLGGDTFHANAFRTNEISKASLDKINVSKLGLRDPGQHKIVEISLVFAGEAYENRTKS